MPERARYANVIWEGRFQPIHRAHVEYVRTLLGHAEHLWLFVVANERSEEVVSSPDELPVPEFTAVVDPHHVPEKNPLPFWLRYRLVQETIAAELPGAPITVWGGRRLDLAWPLYERTLPPDRVFLTPKRDDFEDAKAAAWKSLGERCVRVEVDHLPAISATMLRDRLRTGQDVSDLLCPATEALLRSSGYLERLASPGPVRA
jgi:hypothetical protein